MTCHEFADRHLHKALDIIIDRGIKGGFIKRVNVANERETFLLDEREALEAERITAVHDALQMQLQAILDNPENYQQEIQENSDDLRKALYALLLAAYLLGVRGGESQLATMGLAIDGTQAGMTAGEWSSQRVNQLLAGLNETTRKAVAGIIAEWQQSDGTQQQLQALLESSFNEARAKNITVTETTNSFAEGVVRVAIVAGITIMEWYSMQDERVCPICKPMNGKRRIVGGRYDNGQSSPPAHPGCRCGEIVLIESLLR